MWSGAQHIGGQTSLVCSAKEAHVLREFRNPAKLKILPLMVVGGIPHEPDDIGQWTSILIDWIHVVQNPIAKVGDVVVDHPSHTVVPSCCSRYLPIRAGHICVRQ